jgi:zinc protease
MNSDVNEQPLTPALSPYEGERENRSLVFEHSNGMGFRSPRLIGWFLSFFAVLEMSLVAADNSRQIPDRPEKLNFPPLKYEPPSPEQYRVKLKSGPIAYVVPGRDLPLVNVVVYVHTGQYVEPAGKAGLADLTGYLLARGGIKSKTAEELEERLAFLAAQLNSSIDETRGVVSLNLLSKDLPEGLALLREVLATPRFQPDKLTLRKQQMLQAMQQRNDDSADIEEREAGFLAYGENFWANRYSTAASLGAIGPADLEGFHKKWFYPENFVVAASGDFDRDKMIQQLETLFGDWPFKGEKPPAIPTNTTFAPPGVYIVNKDVNQGRANMMLPGLLRDDPIYFPAMVMNDILGGGGFTSRIVNRVRSDEGLAYDAHSRLPGGVYYPLDFSAGFQSKSRTVPYAAQLVEEEMQALCSKPVDDNELGISKRGFIERFPKSFSTKAQVATTFAQDEFTGRYAKEPDYWKKYRSRVEAVGKEDVMQAAKRLFDLNRLVILIVGQKDQIMLGHPQHPFKITDASKGPLRDVPLRDPLTMQPLPIEQTAPSR